MADRTTIEWTDATWNPIVGCSVTSPGCANCYAMRLAGTRLKHHPSRAGLTVDSKAGPVWTGETRFDEKALTQPLRWKRPRKIFVCAHSDLFHEETPDEWIDRVFAVMALCPQHTFQVLTKRPERMRDYFTTCPGALRRGAVIEQMHAAMRATGAVRFTAIPWPIPNVWLGVTAEDQTRADERIPVLLATPAAKRFVSVEPMLGAVDLERVGGIGSIGNVMPEIVERARRDAHPSLLSGLQIDVITGRTQATIFHQTPDHMGGFSIRFPRPYPRLDWVICGGESGPGARTMHPDWVRSLRDQCAAAGVPFLFKQWGEWGPSEGAASDWLFARKDGTFGVAPCGPIAETVIAKVGKRAAGRLLDGVEHNAFPEQPR